MKYSNKDGAGKNRGFLDREMVKVGIPREMQVFRPMTKPATAENLFIIEKWKDFLLAASARPANLVTYAK